MSTQASENSYKSILKGTSVFGGVQVFQILINLVRGKFVAILLGPEGMGISSLYTTAATTLQQTASLGLNLAIVKEVAAVKDDRNRMSATVATARRLIKWSASAGAILCFLLSPLLSRWSFGTAEHTTAFMLLSAMVLFAIAGSGELSMLQGLHVVKRLSRASIVGAVTGLAVGVPLYYFFGNKGIVPAMITLSLATFLFYRFSVRKSLRELEVGKTRFLWATHKPLVKKLVALGLVLMAGTLIGTFVNYLINAFVRQFGSIENVGLYQAANSITNQYVGVVFSAMAMDYFPRLSKIANDNAAMREVVNRQTEIVSLLLAPLVAGLILTSPIIIRLLLSTSFLEITPLMRWMGLGVLIRGLSYPMGYIAFAKENKRLYFMLEGVMGNALILILSCTFYYFMGLIGLGVALVVESAITMIVYYAVNRRKYSYGYSKLTLVSVAGAVFAGVATFLCSLIQVEWLSITLMCIVFTVTAIISLIEVKKVVSRNNVT